RGTILSIAPYALRYVMPSLLGELPTASMKRSVMALIFLLLTFGYAIVHYQLMDVDLIFNRGVAYTLAAASVVGLYFGMAGLVAQFIQTKLTLGPWGLVAAIIITAVLFDPLKRLIQNRLDQFFD